MLWAPDALGLTTEAQTTKLLRTSGVVDGGRLPPAPENAEVRRVGGRRPRRRRSTRPPRTRRQNKSSRADSDSTTHETGRQKRRVEDVRIVVELRRRSSWVDGQTVTGCAIS
jgi:hypothetical protein